jgi:hypothetical protein
MTEHKKTPWIHTREGISDESYSHISSCHDGFGDIATVWGGESFDQAKANAEFIVKAVNSHLDLVKALTLAEDVLSRSPLSIGIWPNGMHPYTGIEQIRAALKGAA